MIFILDRLVRTLQLEQVYLGNAKFLLLLWNILPLHKFSNGLGIVCDDEDSGEDDSKVCKFQFEFGMGEAKIYQRLNGSCAAALRKDKVGYLLLQIESTAVVELLLSIIVDPICTPLVYHIVLRI